MRTIVLVACVGKKLDQPAPAKELYQSAWFKKARKYAEKHGDQWYILSAKHGLVKPTEVIEPYDVSLTRMSKIARLQWACGVGDQLVVLHSPLLMSCGGGRVIILAGRLYREALTSVLKFWDYAFEVPLEGMGIGQQLAWLERNVA